MVKFASNKRHHQIPSHSGRVSKRQWASKPHLQKRNSGVSQTFLQQTRPALLEGLLLPPIDIARAAAKFNCFVELERIANEREQPVTDRLIAAVAHIDGYHVLPAKQSPESSEKTNVMALVHLAVGPDTDFRLAKEREAVILAEATDDVAESSLSRCIHGFITKRQGWQIVVRVTWKLQDLENLKQLPLRLYIDVNSIAQKSQLEAITKVCQKRFLQNKLAYNVKPSATTLVQAQEPRRSRSRSPSIIWLDDEDDTESSEDSAPAPPAETSANGLNKEQQQAVDEMTKYDTEDLFMLFGPPGTGKTFTLVKAIMELVRTGGRVLVCTPSNKAADNIACSILHESEVSEDGSMYSMYRHVSRTLDPLLVDPRLRGYAGIETNGNKAYYVADEFVNLDNCNIVVTTLGSTPGLRKSVLKKEFSHIVIDEAGQAAEMEVWMPLAFFAAESTRLIVAGDPMQLGPVAPVRLLDDPAYGYKTSILSRLYQNEAFRSDSRNMVQLTKNYRSHESIVNFVSTAFYNSTLEYTRPSGHDSLDDWHRLPQHQFPIFFENTYGPVYTDANGSSYNETEANSVVFYIESLLRSRRVKAYEIGVVSPYTAQIELIRHLLGPSSDVTVDTVEKFQGSERRVIIMTAVRNGTALGFMEDRQRLNTALSRAQQLLIVIGHGRSLEASSDWYRFIYYCKANNAYVDGDIADSRVY